MRETTNMVKYSDSDLIVYAKVNRSHIMMLAKLVEGLGHLGVVTTTDKAEGKVMIQTTTYCWPELREALKHLPIEIAFNDSNNEVICSLHPTS